MKTVHKAGIYTLILVTLITLIEYFFGEISVWPMILYFLLFIQFELEELKKSQTAMVD